MTAVATVAGVRTVPDVAGKAKATAVLLPGEPAVHGATGNLLAPFVRCHL